MANHKGGGDDSEDDDDIVIEVGENFRKHIDALKRACVLEAGHGGYISTPANILSGEATTACEEDEADEEEEDDDELFLSIKSKYGSFGYGDSRKVQKKTPTEKEFDTGASEAENDEEDDDEEILRSVEQLYRTRGGSNKLKVLPKPTSPLIDSSKGANDASRRDVETDPIPSTHASPGCEPGENGDGGYDCFSPQTMSESSVEQVEDAAKSVASFLPGKWIETDGDVQHVDPSPSPLGMLAIEDGGASLGSAPEEPKTYSQPEVANRLIIALEKNQQYQRTLRNSLVQVDEKQKANAEMQRRVRSLVDFEKFCSRRFAGFFTDVPNPAIKLIAVNKMPASQTKASDPNNKTDSDVQTCGPPDNPDVEIFKKLRKKISFTFPTKRWSSEERIELAKGVKQQVYEVLVEQAMDDLSNADSLDEEFTSLDDHMSKIGGKEFTPQQMRDAVPGIDWAEVTRLYLVGRTPEECRTRWMNHEDPLINKLPWKKVEDKKLLSIAQQHNFCAWETIAEQLATNRTPAECLIRYQRSLNASIMRSNWTSEEDERLRAAVGEWGENDWGAVSVCLEGRNNSQCLMRWYKVLHPNKKKSGRWSVEEDKRLKWAVSVFGPKKWKQIAEHVPGRTDLQCRERWCNVLDPGIKLGEWTEDEDRMLEESVVKHGPHRWAAVANDLKIRTDNQCCRRWKFLHPEDQPEFQRTVHIRRTALVGNFQGRKKERPGLSPQDFISKDKDFEALAIKPARKRGVQGKPRKQPTERRGGRNTSLSVPVGDAKERRAARILKRRLARARKASDGVAQITVNALDGPADIGLTETICPEKSVSTSSDAIPNYHAELGNLELSVKSMKRNARQIGNNRKIAMASNVADSVGNRISRSSKGTKRKAAQIVDNAERPKRTRRKVTKVNESLSDSTSLDSLEEVLLARPVSQGKKTSGAKRRIDSVSLGSQENTDSGFQVRSDVGSDGRTLRARGLARLKRTTALAAPGIVDLAPQGLRDSGSQEIEGSGVPEITALGSQGRADLGSQQTTHLGSEAETDLTIRLDSEGRTYVETEIGFERITDLGAPGVSESGSQATPYVSGAQAINQDAVHIGSTKGDVSSPSGPKRRSKRIASKGASTPRGRIDEVALVSPKRRPRISANPSV